MHIWHLAFILFSLLSFCLHEASTVFAGWINVSGFKTSLELTLCYCCITWFSSLSFSRKAKRNSKKYGKGVVDVMFGLENMGFQLFIVSLKRNIKWIGRVSFTLLLELKGHVVRAAAMTQMFFRDEGACESRGFNIKTLAFCILQEKISETCCFSLKAEIIVQNSKSLYVVKTITMLCFYHPFFFLLRN